MTTPTSVRLPIVDIAPLSGDDAAAKRAVAANLRTACRDHGFFYLVGHGISDAQLAEVFASTRALFALPEPAKREIAGNGRPGAHGYALMGGKEEYYLGQERQGDDDNRWPAVLPGFRAVMLAYLEQMHEVSARVMAGLALSLGLPEDHFVLFCTDPIAALRLVRYPPEAAGAAPHTDFGSLTLLLQDDIGGLQVLDRASGGWIDAVPMPGAFVVNIGDLIDRWTNGRYRSTRHRVVNGAGVERFSIPFFLTGAADYPVACLPSCLETGAQPTYPPTTVSGHLRARFAEMAGS